LELQGQILSTKGPGIWLESFEGTTCNHILWVTWQNAEPLVNSYVFCFGGVVELLEKKTTVHNLVVVTHAHPTVELDQGFLQPCRPSARN